LDQGEQRGCVTAEAWLGWWRQSPDVPLRRKLLTLLPRYPNAEVEEVLVDCLDSPDLRGSAARRLGEYGAIRSAIRLSGAGLPLNSKRAESRQYYSGLK
jgi:hypothetical protein